MNPDAVFWLVLVGTVGGFVALIWWDRKNS